MGWLSTGSGITSATTGVFGGSTGATGSTCATGSTGATGSTCATGGLDFPKTSLRNA